MNEHLDEIENRIRDTMKDSSDESKESCADPSNGKDGPSLVEKEFTVPSMEVAPSFGCSDATENGEIDIDGTTVYCQVDAHYKWTKIAAWQTKHTMTPNAVRPDGCASVAGVIDCKFSDTFINALVPAGSNRIYKIESSNANADPAYITTNRDYIDTAWSWNVGPAGEKWPDVRGMVTTVVPSPDKMKNAGQFTPFGKHAHLSGIIDFYGSLITKGSQGESCNRHFVGRWNPDTDCYGDKTPGLRCISGGASCGYRPLPDVVIYMAEFKATNKSPPPVKFTQTILQGCSEESKCGLRSKDKETQFKEKLTCVTSKQELITSEESLITEQDECITKAKNNEFEMSEEDQATIARHKKQKEAHTKLLQALMDLRAHIGDDKELSIPDHLKDSFRFASTSVSIEPRFKAMISMISDLASKESEPTKNALVDALLALLDQLIGQLKKSLNLDDSAAETETKQEELQRKRADEMTAVCTKKRTESQTKIVKFKSEIMQCESELNIISSEMKGKRL
jgi:hypothetical protein